MLKSKLAEIYKILAKKEGKLDVTTEELEEIENTLVPCSVERCME